MPKKIITDFDPQLSMLAYISTLMEKYGLTSLPEFERMFGFYTLKIDFDGAPWVIVWDEGPDEFAHDAASYFNEVFQNLNLPFHAEAKRTQVLAFYRN